MSRSDESPLATQLWRRVQRGPDCWEFQGARLPHGYGKMSHKRKMFLAHRVAWLVTYGPIPEGICVLHRCDNPPCCRPEHLFLGTQAENAADMATKGRSAKADRHPMHRDRERLHRGVENYYNATVSDQQMLAAVAAYGAGEGTQKAIARRFGIGAGLFCRVLHKRARMHLAQAIDALCAGRPPTSGKREAAHRKLTAAQEAAIRHTYAQGQVTQQHLAHQFGVCRSVIAVVVKGRYGALASSMKER